MVENIKWYKHYGEQLKTELPDDAAIPLLSIYLEKIIILPHNVHCSTFYNNQGMEAIQMSIDRGKDKEDVVHIDN